MSKTDMFAASAAALILACVTGWAISDTQARVAAPATVQVDPIALAKAGERDAEELCDGALRAVNPAAPSGWRDRPEGGQGAET